MKSYLEINVPISYDEPWLARLRSHFSGIPVRWQNGFYHITLAFLDETPQNADLRPMLHRHLSKTQAPVITFDRLDVFPTGSGMMIIHLTASQVPEDFNKRTTAIRSDMKATGCQIQSDFKLHVTLGRLKDFNIQLSELRDLTKSFPLTPFTMTLTDVDYRIFRGNTIYKTRLNKKEVFS